MSDPITIKKLVERISNGDIRVPAFQRDFVWEPDQVAFLLDSIYKDFPIGTVILWKTDQRLETEKRLGHFDLPEPQKDYPVNYVLDGQQRLTSLFSVFQTDLEASSEEWVDIYFDLDADDNIQESAFIALDADEVDLGRHFPAKMFFDIIGYRKATDDLSDEAKVKLDGVQQKFLGYLVPNEVFETEDRNRVAIVFERINRSGVELDIFELLAAWSWSEDFSLVDEFDALQDKIEEHGYEDLCIDRDLQLRICAGVITGKTSPQAILELQGEEIRERFDEIVKGILGAIDFLKRELGVEHYKMLPFPGILVPLSCFFATDKADGVQYSSKQLGVMEKWFWRSVFSRRFSSDVNERQAADIVSLLALKEDEDFDFRLPPAEIRFDFSRTGFLSSSANSKTLIIMLNTRLPKSLLSGAKVDLGKVLKRGSKHEYHHVFPRAYLEKLGVPRPEANVLANICFLTRSDNNKVKASAPKDYVAEINEKRRKAYLKAALLPEDIADLDYPTFVRRRSELLEALAIDLMG